MIEELEETFAAPQPVGVLAMKAGVHPVSLARAWRRALGTSITEYLRRRRIQEAAGLLARRSEAISAVAYQTGFSDQSHLTRIFRRETGMTPASFRALVKPRNWRATKEV